MFGGTSRITFEVQLKCETREDYLRAMKMIEERMNRVVQHRVIRVPRWPTTDKQKGNEIAEVISVTKWDRMDGTKRRES